MTEDKGLKKIVRSRMAETGQRYTEARAGVAAERTEPVAVQPRMFGLETTYRARGATAEGRPLESEQLVPEVLRNVVSWGRATNVYLENGAHLYEAAPGLVEYAGPECDRIGDVIVHARAGEQWLLALAGSAADRLREQDGDASVTISQAAGVVGAGHESYLVRRPLDGSELEILVTFLMTRPLLAGAGAVVATRSGPKFVLTRHAAAVTSAAGTPASSWGVPVADIDRAPIADPAKFWRLHVRSGDTNRSDVTTFAKLGMTSLVVRMLETDPARLSDLSPGLPFFAMRTLADDVTGRQPLPRIGGGEISGLDVQRLITVQAIAFVDSEGATADERTALSRWTDGLAALERSPDRLARTVDWAIKRAAIEELAGSLDAPEAAEIDADYHELGDGSLFARLEAEGRVERMTSDEAVSAAVANPPVTTRAHLRGRFIKAAKASSRSYTVDWTHLKLNDRTQATVLVLDPFAAEDPRVDKLIARVATPEGPVAP
jgi:proteasome accessory factor A